MNQIIIVPYFKHDPKFSVVHICIGGHWISYNIEKCVPF